MSQNKDVSREKAAETENKESPTDSTGLKRYATLQGVRKKS